MDSSAKLEQELRAAGLVQWAPLLVASAKPCVMLVPGPADDGAHAPLGASRVGGDPDVPPAFEWPMRPAFEPSSKQRPGAMPGRVLLGRGHWKHRLLQTQRWKQAKENWERMCDAEWYVRAHDWPLSFVAQIDLSEVHSVRALDGFPPAGRLLLFCDAYDLPWGRREQQRRARVLFIEAPGTNLQRRRPPKDFDRPEARTLRDEGFVFGPRRLLPAAWLLPPPLGSSDLLRLEEEDPEAWGSDGIALTAYEQFWINFSARQAKIAGVDSNIVHQVGGTAFSIQKSVEAECTRLSGGGDDWQLILQIDSDAAAGMEWGDSGRLYVCIRRADLVERRFDRSWTVTQCY